MKPNCENKSIISAGISNNTTVKTTARWGADSIPLNKTIKTKGDKFELIDGKIKVLKKCTVNISATASLQAGSVGYKNLSIYVNNNNKVSETYDYGESSQWNNLSLSPLPVDLNKDDLISLNIGSNNSEQDIICAGDHYTYIYVEEILGV